MGSMPVGGVWLIGHAWGMAIRRTLEMLNLGERINDQLYRLRVHGPRPVSGARRNEHVPRVPPLTFVPRSI
jgi:hypothetical protein